MWFGTIILFIYTGIVIWFLYLHRHCNMVVGASRQQECSWSNSPTASYNDIFLSV
uniref:Uncharacterized protein n=1 Tax=Arundo donax TaxID=35708 RepID=A0A0A9QKM6_ARUDO